MAQTMPQTTAQTMPQTMPPTMAAADRACRRINRSHGVSFAWAAQPLPAGQRRHVHVLYALCRRADDAVDTPGLADPAARPTDVRDGFAAALGGAPADDPALVAPARTARVHGLGMELFDRFFAAMAADLTTTRYDTWDDLLGYMDGSAAVIGEMLLPILEPVDVTRAIEPARALGIAFQATNFLRDIDEVLDLGRQYLPHDELARFGVDLADRQVTDEFVALMQFQIARCRGWYDRADAGISLLPVRSARCARTARRLYAAILDRIEVADYDVFADRVVSAPDKLRTVVSSWFR